MWPSLLLLHPNFGATRQLDRMLEQRMASGVVGEQLEDDGWNCAAPQSRRSSFHTTICVLDGIPNRLADNLNRTAIRGTVPGHPALWRDIGDSGEQTRIQVLTD